MVSRSAFQHVGRSALSSAATALLAVLLASPMPAYSAVRAVQAGAGPDVPSTPAQGVEREAAFTRAVSIASLPRTALAGRNGPHAVEGIVVRLTTARTEGEEDISSILIRDAEGDTLSVIGSDARPAPGAHVRVVGRIETDGAGTLRLDAGLGGVVLLSGAGVTPVPANASEDAHSVENIGGGRGWWIVGAALLAGMALLGGLLARVRWWGRRDSAIPLIVNVEALRTKAHCEPHEAAAPPNPVAPGAEQAARAEAPAAPPGEPPPPRAVAAPEPTATHFELPLLRLTDVGVDTSPGAPEPPPTREPNPAPASVVRQDAPQARRLDPVPRRAAAVLPRPEVGAPRPSHGSSPLPEPNAENGGSARELELHPEASLQLLPGMLEIVEGADGPPQIRFFRSAALEVPEVTIGRAHGPPYLHVHLWAPSVSRMHARMRFEAGRWKIANLSTVNPVRLNGRMLATHDEECALSDGDRIQLGEVVLHYRQDGE